MSTLSAATMIVIERLGIIVDILGHQIIRLCKYIYVYFTCKLLSYLPEVRINIVNRVLLLFHFLSKMYYKLFDPFC